LRHNFRHAKPFFVSQPLNSGDVTQILFCKASSMLLESLQAEK
jgi:hypothetical protein